MLKVYVLSGTDETKYGDVKMSSKYNFKKLIKPLLWLLVVLCMGLIFTFSAQDGTRSTETSTKIGTLITKAVVKDYNKLPDNKQRELVTNIDFYVRKAAHFTVYTLLGILLMLAMHCYRLKNGQRFLFTLGIGAAYAASDEIHQLFVPGRSGNPRDVLIDTLGVLFGSFIIYLIFRLLKRKA